MLGAIGVFLAAQYFSARILLKLRGSPFLHKQKFLQIGCAGAKARFSDAQLIIIKPYTHGKSQRSEIFVNKAAEPSAEASNARQGIARNQTRAQPLKARFSDAQLIFIKPYTHGL